MSATEKPPVRARHRWLYLGLLAAVAAPFGIAFYDWAQAVRTARDTASVLAWSKAAGSFLGRDLAQPSISGMTVTHTESPPRTGAFAGYFYATRVELVYEWNPIFQGLIGGSYPIHARATAAVVRNESGQWMPILVE